MKYRSERALRSERPDLTEGQTIGYCLKCLFADKKHKISDEVVSGLNFEELIGALLQAEDLAKGKPED
jgi:hypothetical protein